MIYILKFDNHGLIAAEVARHDLRVKIDLRVFLAAVEKVDSAPLFVYDMQDLLDLSKALLEQDPRIVNSIEARYAWTEDRFRQAAHRWHLQLSHT